MRKRFFPLALVPLLVAASPEGAPTADIALLTWMAGCWELRDGPRIVEEYWTLPRGGLMLGHSRTIRNDAAVAFEQLLIQESTTGTSLHASPSAQAPTDFRAIEISATAAVFVNPEHDFPQRIVYRRGTEGWLYIHVEGRVQGEERKVIYPLRRIDCESGDLIAK